ncbi:hypothetical protein PZB74_15275 [Porifericola rhodea]|uniref:hypothetical protein n=1 Tax=Porifericola rhodea TaxID=930972 RepID=UPI002666E2E7|nr:hypothetical protein [Porifericola rhodea]WKN30325.1 hypothetical protein PZB74_15275 [Porifericola rhodea]
MEIFKYLILFQIIFNSAPIFGQSKIAEHFESENFDCAIFPKEYNDFIDEERFTPTRAEIELAEETLQSNLKKINRNLVNQDGTKYNPIIHQNLKKYKRQYFGYLDEDGNRILLINAFWGEDESSDDWLRERVLVFDGGSYYWSIRYNIDKHKLFGLQVNGNA